MICVVVLWLLSSQYTLAQELQIPAGVQAQLLAKIPAYDYGFRQRAGGRVQVLILTNPERATSVSVAGLLEAALLQQKDIASLPHAAFVMPFASIEALVTEVKARAVTIVYLASGLEAHLAEICAALEPFQVLTVSAQPEDVRRCAVLGFEILGGRPRVLIHLAHARRNGIRFRSELLSLATVYR
jgi:uncharacterized protein DUF4154